jgi:hypothetical protein
MVGNGKNILNIYWITNWTCDIVSIYEEESLHLSFSNAIYLANKHL